MSRKEPMRLTKDELRKYNKKLTPWNFVIMLVAIAVCVVLFFGSFFRVTIAIPLTTLADFIGVDYDGGGYSNGYTEDPYYDENDPYPYSVGIDAYDNNGYNDNYDNEDMLGMLLGILFDAIDSDVFEGIEISLQLTITNRSLIRGVFGNPMQSVLEETLYDLTGQVSPMLETIIDAVVRVMVVNSVDAALREIHGEVYNMPDVMAAVDLDSLGDILGNILGGEYDETTARVSLIDWIIDVAGEMELSQAERNLTIYEFTSMITDALDAIYAEIADDYGYVNVRQMMMSVIGMVIGMEGDGNFSDEELAAGLAAFMIERLEYIGLDWILNLAIISLMVLLLLTIFVWALLALFAFIRLFTKNKRVYLGNARGFGWVVPSLFFVVPSIAWLIIRLTVDGLDGISIRFMSWTIASLAGAVLLMLMNWFGYARLKRRIKRAVIVEGNEGSQDNNNSWNGSNNNNNDNSNAPWNKNNNNTW
ncbi:MAG: hypothetical protein FWE22_00670 [Firmicutes bacterium]|nr:hypothetical protein [Bacillota bacterium]